MSSTSLAIVTDAWTPQVNGVVKTLQKTRDALEQSGYQVTMLTPADHRTIPCPSYPEIRLALRNPDFTTARRIEPEQGLRGRILFALRCAKLPELATLGRHSPTHLNVIRCWGLW